MRSRHENNEDEEEAFFASPPPSPFTPAMSGVLVKEENRSGLGGKGDLRKAVVLGGLEEGEIRNGCAEKRKFTVKFLHSSDKPRQAPFRSRQRLHLARYHGWVLRNRGLRWLRNEKLRLVR